MITSGGAPSFPVKSGGDIYTGKGAARREPTGGRSSGRNRFLTPESRRRAAAARNPPRRLSDGSARSSRAVPVRWSVRAFGSSSSSAHKGLLAFTRTALCKRTSQRMKVVQGCTRSTRDTAAPGGLTFVGPHVDHGARAHGTHHSTLRTPSKRSADAKRFLPRTAASIRRVCRVQRAARRA